MKRYLTNVIVSLNRLIWAMMGGDPDETISAAMWRLERRGNRFAAAARRFIDSIDRTPDHCLRAYRSAARRRVDGDYCEAKRK